MKPEKLRDWEDGTDRPTFKQARKLAARLYVPFGFLYLHDPPEDNLPLPDFRTVAGAPECRPSPDFLDVLSDALRKQQWYRQHQEGLGVDHLDFVGRFTEQDDHRLIAADIRNALQIDDKMREESRSWERFLQDFIRRAESRGVLVLRSGIVGNNTHRPLHVQEFRGFAVSDTLAPVIFVNGRDAKAAQIFTVAHELAHLWMGQTGVSNPDYLDQLSAPPNAIERVANRVSAETLLPADELLHFWDERQGMRDNIEALAGRYRISQFVVLRIAFDNDKLSESQYYACYQGLVAEHRRSSGVSGGNFYRSLLARNSSTLTMTLLIAYAEGRVTQREAASLLNVKVKSIPSIQREILGGFSDG